MTYRNRLIILSSALGVLVILFIASMVFSPENTWKRAAAGRLVQAESIESIDTIDIQTPAGKTTLVKADGSWYIEADGARFPAQKTRIDSFLKSLVESSDLFTVSQNRDTWKDFSVTEDTAKHIILKGAKGALLGDFYVGKQEPTARGIYVRFADKDATWQVENNFSSYLDGGREYWESLRLLPEGITERNVQSFSVKANLSFDNAGQKKIDASYRLTRGRGETWIAEGNPNLALENIKVKGAVSRFVDFTGSEYSPLSGPETGLENPSATVTMQTGDAATLTILIGSRLKDTGKFYVRLQGSPYTMLANGWSIEGAIVPLDFFKSAPPASKKK
jgi:hypothetical protein